jgi:hypothetical protein
VTGDKQIPLRCAFADFGVRDGLMTSQALAVDTTDTILIGEGTVSLRDETLDLLLKPRPKDKSILVLRSPLHIAGTFKDPSFRPTSRRWGIRGAVALALGSIAPPAALLATIELGPGKDADCGGSMRSRSVVRGACIDGGLRGRVTQAGHAHALRLSDVSGRRCFCFCTCCWRAGGPQARQRTPHPATMYCCS